MRSEGALCACGCSGLVLTEHILFYKENLFACRIVSVCAVCSRYLAINSKALCN